MSRRKLILITGWAHGPSALHPLAERLSRAFDIRILSAAEVLTSGEIPEADGIVGWSMGGMLAMEHLPASCKKLVLISSTARFCSDSEYACGTAPKTLRSFTTLLHRRPQAVLPEIAATIYRPHGIPAFPAADSSDLAVLTDGLNYLQKTDLRGIAATLPIPVLLLHGTEDSMIPPSASEWLHQQAPNSQLNLFSNEGHALPLQQPKLVAEQIHCFLTPSEPE